MAFAGAPSGSDAVFHRVLSRAIDVKASEAPALAWSWLYIFSLLSAYYILRPIRDQMGVASGVNNLQWLFTGTLVAVRIAWFFSVPYLIRVLDRRPEQRRRRAPASWRLVIKFCKQRIVQSRQPTFVAAVEVDDGDVGRGIKVGEDEADPPSGGGETPGGDLPIAAGDRRDRAVRD